MEGQGGENGIAAAAGPRPRARGGDAPGALSASPRDREAVQNGHPGSIVLMVLIWLALWLHYDPGARRQARRASSAAAPCAPDLGQRAARHAMCFLRIEPSPVRQAAHGGTMRPAAALTHASDALEADAPAERAPMRGIQITQLSPDRHGVNYPDIQAPS